MSALTLPAYAKLNLTLDILSRRPDGYHEMRMLMQTISLHDEVRVALTDDAGITCAVSGADLPSDGHNLAVRAAQAFFAGSGIAPRGVSIALAKRIPSQAGMAGGSADAAAVLRALRALLCPSLTDGALAAIAAQVGSDVPFCLRGGTQLAEGRGELLTPLSPAPRLYAAVCKPDFSISTPALFAQSDRVTLTQRPDTDAALAALRAGDAAALCASVGNVFEQVLLPDQRAQIDEIKRALLAAGARCAAMTGSGSAVFALFDAPDPCRAACAALAGARMQTFFTRFV